jgi:hypothetical protein
MNTAKRFLVGWALTLTLAGCGPDALTAAGTAANSAAMAAKQGQQDKAVADQKIKAMQEALQQHDRDLREQADHGPDRGTQ